MRADTITLTGTFLLKNKKYVHFNITLNLLQTICPQSCLCKNPMNSFGQLEVPGNYSQKAGKAILETLRAHAHGPPKKTRAFGARNLPPPSNNFNPATALEMVETRLKEAVPRSYAKEIKYSALALKNAYIVLKFIFLQ